MNDKELMENLLMLEKGACDLFVHGTMESPTANVRKVFGDALEQSLTMQSSIYSQMQQQGWYAVQQAQPQQVSQLRQKFSAQ